MKEMKDINGDNCSSLLKFDDWDPIHEVVQNKVSEAVDQIAIDRELDLEDEDSLIERKKQELNKWFINHYAHELNQRANGIPGQNHMNASGENGNLAFQNLLAMTKLQNIDDLNQ